MCPKRYSVGEICGWNYKDLLEFLPFFGPTTIAIHKALGKNSDYLK